VLVSFLLPDIAPDRIAKELAKLDGCARCVIYDAHLEDLTPFISLRASRFQGP
jgi:hypothetical protein